MDGCGDRHKRVGQSKRWSVGDSRGRWLLLRGATLRSPTVLSAKQHVEQSCMSSAATAYNADPRPRVLKARNCAVNRRVYAKDGQVNVNSKAFAMLARTMPLRLPELDFLSACAICVFLPAP